MDIPYAVSVQIIWKKDNKRQETKSSPKMGGKGDGANKTNFNGEKISMISTIFRDQNKVSEKISDLVVKISKEDKTRSVGQVKLNLGKYVDVTEESEVIRMKLEKCPDPDGYIEFTVCSTLISTGGTASETMSMMSGIDMMSEMDSTTNNQNFNMDDSTS